MGNLLTALVIAAKCGIGILGVTVVLIALVNFLNLVKSEDEK